jgi:long-chain fatty acid transport protein
LLEAPAEELARQPEGNSVKKNVLALSIASAFLFIAAERAHGAGFALYEQGISGMGNAYAGAAAVAEDATTVWWNPAGMARLPKGMNVAVGGAAIMPSWKFSNNGSVPALGSNPAKNGNGGDAGDTAFVPSAFFAMDLNPVWSFGVGISVPFGLKTEYDANWIGRFQGIKSEVQTVNVNPAVSYKFSDALSVGAGINPHVKRSTSLPASTRRHTGIRRRKPRTRSTSTATLGDSTSAPCSTSSATRAGIHYRSRSTTSSTGTRNSSACRPRGRESEVQNGNIVRPLWTTRRQVAHRMNETLELLGDVTRWHLSRLSIPVVRTDGPLGSTPSTPNSTSTTVTGPADRSQPQVVPAADANRPHRPAPVPAESRTVRLPDRIAYWLSFGAKYQASRKDVTDVGYVHISARTPISTTSRTTRRPRSQRQRRRHVQASVNVFDSNTSTLSALNESAQIRPARMKASPTGKALTPRSCRRATSAK